MVALPLPVRNVWIAIMRVESSSCRGALLISNESRENAGRAAIRPKVKKRKKSDPRGIYIMPFIMVGAFSLSLMIFGMPLEGWATWTIVSLALISVRWLRKYRRCKLPPIGNYNLVMFLRDYSVQEKGSLFIYLPCPTGSDDQEARACFEILYALGAIGGGPWIISLADVPNSIIEANPVLFSGGKKSFHVYHFKRDIFSRLLDRA